MDVGIHLRSARPEDLPEIDAIHNHYVKTSTCTFELEPGTLVERRAWFDEHDVAHPIVVAVEHGPPESAVVGWASLSRYHARPAYAKTVELSVYVRHDRRGAGIGRALVELLLERARALRHPVVVGGVCAEQLDRIALHRTLGFREAGRLREVGVKFGRWLDVLYFERVIDEARAG
jgi:phosphinothricin acetyltransferase